MREQLKEEHKASSLVACPEHGQELTERGTERERLVSRGRERDAGGDGEQQHLGVAVATDVVELVRPLEHALKDLWRAVHGQLAAALGILEKQREAAQEASEEQVARVLSIAQLARQAPYNVHGRHVGRQECRRPADVREVRLESVHASRQHLQHLQHALARVRTQQEASSIR